MSHQKVHVDEAPRLPADYESLLIELHRVFQNIATAVNTLNDLSRYGEFTIADAVTSVMVILDPDEEDIDYGVVVTPAESTGTPTTGSNRILSIVRSTTNFVVNLEAAPGVGNSRTFTWQLLRREKE